MCSEIGEIKVFIILLWLIFCVIMVMGSNLVLDLRQQQPLFIHPKILKMAAGRDEMNKVHWGLKLQISGIT